MVGGAFWPTTLGAPSHLMAFYDTTLHIVSAGCSLNSTHFTVNALQQVRCPGLTERKVSSTAGRGRLMPGDASRSQFQARHRGCPHPSRLSAYLSYCFPLSLSPRAQVLGRNDTVAMLDDHTFEVGGPVHARA